VTEGPIIPEGQDFVDVTIRPSEGRVRAVRVRPGVVQYQDPDVAFRRTYRDGRVVTITNPFITRNNAIARLRFDFDRNRVLDSFDDVVGSRYLGIPSTGRVSERKVFDLRWDRLGTDPRRYDPRPNEEIVERLVLVDKNGNIYTRETSYGLGQKYDRSKRGGWYRAQTSRALGLEEGKRVETRDLQKAVIHREFIRKRLVPR
jgi:hypothetical protein